MKQHASRHHCTVIIGFFNTLLYCLNPSPFQPHPTPFSFQSTCSLPSFSFQYYVEHYRSFEDFCEITDLCYLTSRTQKFVRLASRPYISDEKSRIPWNVRLIVTTSDFYICVANFS